jgi:hypothetical protein
LLAESLPQGGYRIAEFHALDLRDLEREAIVVDVLLYNRAMPNTVVEYGQAIYYPHIRFRNREWLRTSALYHDKIWRIVPPGLIDAELELGDHDLPDRKITEEIRILRNEGIVDNEDVSPVVAKVGKDFAEFVEANLKDRERREQLIPALSADQRYQWYRIYPGKIDPKLRELLRKLKLGRELPHDRHGDWELDITTGGMYMYFLAQALAKNRPIISDNPKFQALAYAKPELKLNKRGTPDFDKGFVLGVAAFDTVHPLGIEHVPIRDLIKFRHEHEEERTRFQQEISKLAKDMGSIDHPDQVNDALQPHVKTIKQGTKRLKTKLKALKVECVKGVFTFSVPAWGTASAVSLGALATNPYVVAGAGVVAMGFALTKYRLDRDIALGESPWSYLLSLERKLTPLNATQNLISLNLSGGARRSDYG